MVPVIMCVVVIVFAVAILKVLVMPKSHVFASHFTVGQGWINNYFTAVYVVTLPTRKAYIKRVMSLMKVQPIFIDAVLADNLDRKALIAGNLITPDCTLSLPRIACHLSHSLAMQHFLANPEAQTALIFEDDIAPLADDLELQRLQDTMGSFMLNVPSDWDIINFGRCWDTCSNNVKVSDNVYIAYKALCRHAYAVTRQGAKRILWNTLPMKGAKQSDETIADMTAQGKLIMYVPKRALFDQNRFMLGSNLDNDNPEHFQRECSDM